MIHLETMIWLFSLQSSRVFQNAQQTKADAAKHQPHDILTMLVEH